MCSIEEGCETNCQVQTNLLEPDEEGSIWLQLEVLLAIKEH